MKVSVTRDNLQEALSAVDAAVPTRATLPVLTNVLLEAKDGRLRLSATDMDLTVRASTAAEVEEAGSITVPAKKLRSLVREFATGAVKLVSNGGELKIQSGRTKVALKGMSAGDYPQLQAINYENGFDLPAGVLRDLITRSTYAVSTEESRPILNGVLWQILEGEMRMVATNGHRLAKNTIVMNGSTPAPAQMIVPPAALNQIDRLLGDATAVRVARNDNFIGFKAGDKEISSRLIDGQYPDYERVIPRGNDKEVVVDRAGMEQVIRRMAVVAHETTNRIILDLQEGSVKFRVESPDTGSAEDEVPAEYTGEPMTIAFNAAYLLETLRKVPTDSVRMTFSNGARAAMVLPEGAAEDAARFEALVMPLRLDG